MLTVINCLDKHKSLLRVLLKFREISFTALIRTHHRSQTPSSSILYRVHCLNCVISSLKCSQVLPETIIGTPWDYLKLYLHISTTWILSKLIVFYLCSCPVLTPLERGEWMENAVCGRWRWIYVFNSHNKILFPISRCQVWAPGHWPPPEPGSEDEE